MHAVTECCYTVQLVLLTILRSQALIRDTLQPEAPHWLMLSELLGAPGRPRRLIGSTPQQALRHKKRRLLPTPLLERGQCVILRLVASTNSPTQYAIANEMEETAPLVIFFKKVREDFVRLL